jgi:2-aminoethylphosphonate-pyruvate transaminase
MTPERPVLFTPGPVMVSPRVQAALAAAQFSHRDPTFSRMLAGVRARLAAVAGAPRHDPLVIAGSATAAIEAAFSTLLSRHETLLVVSNGAFGERLAELALILGLPVRQIRQRWGDVIDPSEVEAAIDACPEITTIALVHHDTSVGILNPVAEIGALAARRGRRLFVDVVSTLGAEPFDAEAANVAVAIGSANKCLESVAGLSFVLVRHDAWRTDVTPRTLYLDLRRYRSATPSDAGVPFTPAVAAVAALHEALLELADEGGPAARRRRYAARNSQLRAGLGRHGIVPYFSRGPQSCAVTIATLPPGFDSAGWYAALRERGFVVYETKGVLRRHAFLAANMGHLSAATVDSFVDAVGAALLTRSAAV